MVERESKRQRDSNWRQCSALGTRESFIEKYTNPDNALVLRQFNTVVFGLAYLYRTNLLGGVEMEASNYNTGAGTGLERTSNSSALNFRTLLLSAFKPHGGVDCSDSSLYDQHVVYVEISRESAADILTVLRFISMVQRQICPGEKGRPRYVIIGGDEPSFKMYCDMWVSSWRKSGGGDICNGKTSGKLELHEWLIPFPGFFHTEKQAMYSICKELLDGLGLTELASCAGLSKSQVQNILSHSHARNNRAVLFNLATAMVIHLIDMLLLEDDCVRVYVERIKKSISPKRVSVDAPIGNTLSSSVETTCTRPPRFTGRLYEATTEIVSNEVLDIGTKLVDNIEQRFGFGPNCKHFVHTVLLSSLLPTMGFHVLSRTGHTDLIDAFWFKQNSILHSTGHLKYQQVSIFYGFFKCIIPEVIIKELYDDKPGRSVTKLLSFTGSGKDAVDRRGWTYVHRDEELEMLMVRHLKSLSVNFLGHLENSAAWLKEVSMFRTLIRYVTGASRSFGRRRQLQDGGELPGPLSEYDRTACQWRTVARMVHVMREKGFLSLSHRGSEWLTNVFSDPPVRMNNEKDQSLILNIAERGKLTAELHASVLFPDLFGKLSDQDRLLHFEGHKFKRWTRRRSVPRPAQLMSKQNGSVSLMGGNSSVMGAELVPVGKSQTKRPKDRESYTKLLTESRRKVAKAKDSFYLEERRALSLNDMDYLGEVMRRWDSVHNARHKVSPYADCFLNHKGKLNHGTKSRFLKYSRSNNRDVVHNLNMLPAAEDTPELPSQFIFEAHIRPYYSIQFDVMNALHYRGDTGERGTILQSVVTGKMNTVLRQWLRGPRAEQLRQVHLHIDDPTRVISQKRSEQVRRDETRKSSNASPEDVDMSWVVEKPDFQDHLHVSWGSLISDRAYKDELASLHLFCAAVAAFELLTELRHPCSVFLHGGSFALQNGFLKSRPEDYTARRYHEGLELVFKGCVILRREEKGLRSADLVVVPRSRCLIFETNGNLRISDTCIEHGESETRFVSAYNVFVASHFTEFLSKQPRLRERNRNVRRTPSFLSGSLIVSDDTDVLLILISNSSLEGCRTQHVLSDTVHFLDVIFARVRGRNFSTKTLALAYALAGCDFTPSMFGIRHEVLYEALLHFEKHVGNLELVSPNNSALWESFLCLVYLYKQGKRYVCKEAESKQLIIDCMAAVEGEDTKDRAVSALQKAIFACDHEVGTEQWKVAVRNSITDCASSSNDLMPPLPHYMLHVRRALFVVGRYWSQAGRLNISSNVVGGCNSGCGYNDDGSILLETPEGIAQEQKSMQKVYSFCGCKGDCTTRRCSCVKEGIKCIGCSCNNVLCKNKVETGQGNTGSTEAVQSAHGTEPTETQSSAPLHQQYQVAHNALQEILNSLDESDEDPGSEVSGHSEGNDSSGSVEDDVDEVLLDMEEE